MTPVTLHHGRREGAREFHDCRDIRLQHRQHVLRFEKKAIAQRNAASQHEHGHHTSRLFIEEAHVDDQPHTTSMFGCTGAAGGRRWQEILHLSDDVCDGRHAESQPRIVHQNVDLQGPCAN